MLVHLPPLRVLSALILYRFYATKVSATKIAAAIPKGRVMWKDHWNQIEIMRGGTVAPVDSMGAQALPSLSEDAREYRFQTLVGTMLSPQTKDQQTYQAFTNLHGLIKPKAFLPSNLRGLSIDQVEVAIRQVSFYKVKAKNLLLAAEQCQERYQDDIPSKIDDLLAFPGVGPKIAYLTFTIAWKQTLGICVDTHVHRISNRLGWVDTWYIPEVKNNKKDGDNSSSSSIRKRRSNGPEFTRKELESFLPQEHYWEQVNYLLVGFGQTICGAMKPKCEICSLKNSCQFYLDPNHMRDEKEGQ